MARLILALRWPNNVPVMRVPPWMFPSWRRLPLSDKGILQVGVIIGKDRKTALKRRKSLADLEGPILLVGCWREIAGREGDRGDLGDEGSDFGDKGVCSGEDCGGSCDGGGEAFAVVRRGISNDM
ncbi:hypothetical protein GH714_036721 [Hevea brasiliensis]|uniref:Uncharacterized protein n=1 Tax=Hevea brasiliensis TaxID=3981 RepID=A0A6A6NEZ6_HEVBR|nr:hypothetical protein GH714_036721 [Hevea brasiliensis]